MLSSLPASDRFLVTVLKPSLSSFTPSKNVPLFLHVSSVGIFCADVGGVVVVGARVFLVASKKPLQLRDLFRKFFYFVLLLFDY